MKFSFLLALAILAGASAKREQTPMDQTVKLIEHLEEEIKHDGKQEQESFDAYACWCEKTTQRKAADISKAKENIKETLLIIKRLKAEVASHGAEIKQLKKDVAANKASVQEATEVRTKQHHDYLAERTESEQCIGALEAAIKVLTPDSRRDAFLQGSMHEAELLSVVAGVRMALGHQVSAQTMASDDIEMMRHFVAKPGDFVGKSATAMSAAQVDQNPFGDYAPQSTRIQGILKGMYDSFTADLEKDKVNEAESQKSFEELMSTKRSELETMQSTLMKQETDKAAKDKEVADSEEFVDITNGDLRADTDFFEDTKAACSAKATEWSVRTRLRTEELNGMEEAIKILTSDNAKKVFKNSTTTFVQLKSTHKHATKTGSESLLQMRSNAYSHLKQIAEQSKSRMVAKVASAVKSGNKFDKITIMIDEMIALLRKEEADDIAHRDRCEDDLMANKYANQAAEEKIEKAKETHERLQHRIDTLKDDLGTLTMQGGDIEATKSDQMKLETFRNAEINEFRQALKDDAEAVSLLNQAMAVLSKFYANNKIPIPQLLQEGEPKYTEDPDEAPQTTWSAGDSRKGETGGILAILRMLAEDVEKEMAEARADDADSQEKYLKQRKALENSMDALQESKAGMEAELADLAQASSKNERRGAAAAKDQEAEGATAKTIEMDCSWIKDHFQDRRDKRKQEMQGLTDAKGFLSGVSAGLDPLPPAA